MWYCRGQRASSGCGNNCRLSPAPPARRVGDACRLPPSCPALLPPAAACCIPLCTLCCSHVERTLETFCNMNLEMQESQNIGKINKQVGQAGRQGRQGRCCVSRVGHAVCGVVCRVTWPSG